MDGGQSQTSSTGGSSPSLGWGGIRGQRVSFTSGLQGRTFYMSPVTDVVLSDNHRPSIPNQWGRNGDGRHYGRTGSGTWDEKEDREL